MVLLLVILLTTAVNYNCPTFVSAYETQSEFCTTKRHVHLSSRIDASTSITISFSSHPCDIRDHNQTRERLMKNDNHNAEKQYSVYEDLEPKRGGVVLSTNRDDVVSDSHDHLIMIDKNDDTTGTIRRYNATIIKKNQRIEYWSEYQYHVIVTGLKPNTKYYYKCIVEDISLTSYIDGNIVDNDGDDDDYYNNDGGGGHNSANEDYYRRRKAQIHTENYTHPTIIDDDEDSIFSFITSPPKNDKDSRIKFAVIGDLGVFETSKESLRSIKAYSDAIDFVILAGDISYANGDHRIWDEFFDMIDEMRFFKEKPLYTAVGNHDVESNAETGEMFTSYENRFLMPQLGKAQIGRATMKSDFDLNKMYKLQYDYGNSYYSFSYGPSHNIVLNAFADFTPSSRQYKWLVSELRDINRGSSPWLTITVHCPMYNTFLQHSNDPQPVNLKLFLEPLFVKYKVNFIFSGHLHAYMRTKQVAFDVVTEGGPIHLIVGDSGRQANAPFLKDEPEEWVHIRDHRTYGWSSIEFLNATTAKYEWVQTGHNKESETPNNVSDVAFIYNQYYFR